MLNKLPSIITHEIQEKRIVGSGLVIYENNKTHYNYFGHENLDHGSREINESSIFEIGSITKTLTGLLAAKLILDNKLSLDSSVYELNITKNKSINQITLRALLTHSSGLPRLPINLQPKNPDNPYEDYTVELLKDCLDSLKLNNQNYCYSNLGFSLVGQIIEKNTGKSIEENLNTEIFKPLNFQNTSFSKTNTLSLVKGYDENLKLKPQWDSIIFKTSGGLRSNLLDMGKYLEFLTSSDSHVLRKALNLSIEVYFKGDVDMGLGWHISDSGILSQDGATYGSYSKLRITRSQNKGFIYLSNTYNSVKDLEL